MRLRAAIVSLTLVGVGVLLATASPESAGEVWVFDRLDRIGGHPTTVLGHPRVIDTPQGKAIEFNGVDDGLQLDVHPLAGAETYTWEAVFRPDGGNAEQRWFHLEEKPATGLDSNNRMLFEIRVIEGRWCLDAFNKSGDAQKALLDRAKSARHSAAGITSQQFTTAGRFAATSMACRMGRPPFILPRRDRAAHRSGCG